MDTNRSAGRLPVTYELQIGSKKVYLIDHIDKGEDRVDVMMDCEACHGAGMLVVRMTGNQFATWQSRTRLIQEIFPDLKPAVREALISGTTPLEWRAMFGRRPGQKRYTIGECQAMGYVFDEQFPADKLAPQ